MLTRDILAESERKHTARAEVVLTLVGGRVVYERRGEGQPEGVLPDRESHCPPPRPASE